VELLFGVQLGGGTDINLALTYCHKYITRPTIQYRSSITDLYEGVTRQACVKRSTELAAAGSAGDRVIGLE
jgi:hypothetical protein